MKTLLLLRHAKSSKDDPTLNDFDRPLTDRGEADAGLIGKYLIKQQVSPDVIISSPARRAQQTTELVLKSAKIRRQPVIDERIYEAGVHQLLRVVADIDGPAASALVVGHNPGFEDLVNLLTGEYQRLPTATLTCIELSISNWTSLSVGKGRLKWIVTPKNLKHKSED